MARVQLAFNVSDMDAAVGFYRTLFGTEPAKRRPGYANFVIADPPMKLVLIEDTRTRGTGVVGALNHVGIEVQTTAEVADETRRLADAGLNPLVEQGVECCYANQDKAWAQDPDGVPWEIYTVLSDAAVPDDSGKADRGRTNALPGCCTPSVLASTLAEGRPEPAAADRG